MSASTKRLAIAAEELVKAASMEVDSVTQLKLSSNLESLKESFDSKLNNVNQVVKTLSDKFDVGINKLDQNQGDIKNLLEKQNIIMTKQNKISNLQWAYAHCEMGAFQYKEIDNRNNSAKSSTELARKVISSFMTDKGMFVDDNNVSASFDCSYSQSKKEELEKSRQAFRDSLKVHISKLIGKEPRVAKFGDSNNGEYAIW
eukprot:CAMPEP_0194370292 /NCGR_PEP_ID=MMETSP0174-20130528/18565_1 /TAXON_ID=216777 /ORGANISM="Proboscia alata, Strain PI-D3" /LENGTH=200 /DNA_ID=CAMNT_0039147643 /DNA_START=112 /DNA_END=711 /DNA_ORIENTATION=+